MIANGIYGNMSSIEKSPEALEVKMGTGGDTFTSLKKTCKKLVLSFGEYLRDRLSNHKQIPRLKDLVMQKSQKVFASVTA